MRKCLYAGAGMLASYQDLETPTRHVAMRHPLPALHEQNHPVFRIREGDVGAGETRRWTREGGFTCNLALVFEEPPLWNHKAAEYIPRNAGAMASFLFLP